MLHYIALVWNFADSNQNDCANILACRLRTLAPDWRCALDQAGCQVFYADTRRTSMAALRLKNQSGVVLGNVFGLGNSPHLGPSRQASFDAAESAAIVASGGRKLVNGYWGRYVAFVCDAASGKRWVLRDPTGRLPCFMTRHRGVHVVFSSPEDVMQLDRLAFSINWSYVGIRAITSVAETSETALTEVSNVLGGECVEFSLEEVSRSFYWHPSRFVLPVIEDPEEAAMSLRSTVKACVHTWAAGHDSILAMLSGGLDSSIVVGCLQDAPTRPQVTCLNFHSRGARSDERTFARLAAGRAGYDLVEEERDPRVNLTAMLRFPRTAQPFHYPYKLEVGEAQARVAGEARATAIFDGNGGDGLFYATPVRPAIRDYLHHHGLGREFLDIAIDVAHQERASIWSVLRSAIRDRPSKRPWDPLREAYRYRRLVRPDIIEIVRRERRFLHPWFHTAGDTPPGKLWHMFYMSIPLNFDHQIGDSDECELVLPLISQPIFELLLRIPTYRLVMGGRDRAIARRAFAPDVPAEILTRRTKGFREEHTRAILDRNRAFARDMLLGGLLVEHGILDASKLEDVLSGRPTNVGAATNEIFSHLSTEVWLRNWVHVRRKAAA